MPWSAGTYTKWNASNVPPNWVGDASVGINIEASRHDTQDDDFAAGINACLNKAGQNAPTANLPMGGFKHTNVADATANNQYASYGQLLTFMPTGVITAYGAAVAPSGWLLCNGSAISRTTYATLFATIGTTYGAGDGATTFNLPDLQQRFPLGKAAAGTGATLGGTGGNIDHTHSLPAHYHGMGTGSTAAVDIAHNHGSSSVSGTVGGSDGTHSHTEAACNTGTSGTAPIDRFQITGRTGAALATVNITSTGSGHGHSFSLTAAGQTLSTTSKSVTGTVGLVTGGVDGNAAMTSGTANPPFLTVNYIIKT